jgi:hypothetical protein
MKSAIAIFRKIFQELNMPDQELASSRSIRGCTAPRVMRGRGARLIPSSASAGAAFPFGPGDATRAHHLTHITSHGMVCARASESDVPFIRTAYTYFLSAIP